MAQRLGDVLFLEVGKLGKKLSRQWEASVRPLQVSDL
jgi:hypothetical protein